MRGLPLQPSRLDHRRMCGPGVENIPWPRIKPLHYHCTPVAPGLLAMRLVAIFAGASSKSI